MQQNESTRVGTNPECDGLGMVGNMDDIFALIEDLFAWIEELVWITVHCAHNLENDWNKPVSYAIKVTCVEFARWERNGWANHFLM